MLRQLFSIVTFLLLLVSQASALEYWTWTPTADYHKNAVVVRIGSNRLSGGYIQYETLTGILTAAHGFREFSIGTPVKITFQDGASITTTNWTRDKYGYDLVFIPLLKKDLNPLPIADTPPQPGEKAEVLGFGGPRDNELRHFTATVSNSRLGTAATIPDLVLNDYVIHGDSGGMIVQDGKVISVQSYGIDKVTDNPVIIYKGSGGPHTTAIINFLGRVRVNCPNGQCGIPAPAPLPSNRTSPALYPSPPPASSTPPNVQSKAPTNPPSPPVAKEVTLDYQKLASAVIEKIKDDPNFKGPKGDKGEPGLAGPQGMPGIPGTPGKNANEQGFTIAFQNADGTIAHKQEIKPGGTALIPPVKLEIYRPEGEVKTQAKPLGEPIKLLVIPEGG